MERFKLLTRSKQANIALIGYGYWGKKLFNYLKSSQDFQLSHVYFPSLQKYDSAAVLSQWGSEFTSDINRIWNDNQSSHVLVATPIETHAEIVSQALNHGKNVLVEKPLAASGPEASRLADLAKDRGLVLETEYTYTFSNALKSAQNLIAEGAVGELKSICIDFQQLGRFQIHDVYALLGSHALSILDLFVPLEECIFSSFPVMRKNGVVTAACISFRSNKNQCSGTIHINLHCPRRSKTVFLIGERGTIEYRPEDQESLSLTTHHSALNASAMPHIARKESYIIDEKNNLQNALHHFFQVIQKQQESNINRSVTISKVLDTFRSNG